MVKYFIAHIVLLFFFTNVYSDSYLPNIKCYDKQYYKAGRQNWDVDIDDLGVIYFGNSNGLLCNIFGQWELKTMTNKGMVNSVHVSNDTIYCGGTEYGYFYKKDGQLEFNSLGNAGIEQVWNIESIDDYIIYQAENQIIFYNKVDQSIQVNKLEERVWSIINWRGKIWAVLGDGQIGYFQGNTFHNVILDERLRNKEVRSLFEQDGCIYMVSYEDGIFRFNGEVLDKISLPIEVDSSSLFAGIAYDDHSFCLGTISDGFLHLDFEGNLLNSVNSENGLIDNTILSMKRDRLGNIWIGLDYGIAKIELQDAVKFRFDGAATYSITDFEGSTYLATNKGLFCAKKNSDFELQKQLSGQTWILRHIEDKLFVCHNRGLIKIKDGKLIRLVEGKGFLDVARFKGTDYYLCSTYDGLILYRIDESICKYIWNLDLWGNRRLYYDERNNCIWAQMRDETVYKLSLLANSKIKAEEHPELARILKTSKGIFFTDNKYLYNYQNGFPNKVNSSLLNTVDCNQLVAMDISADGNSVAYVQDNNVKLESILPDGNIHSYNTLLNTLGASLVKNFEFLQLKQGILRIATDRGITSFDMNYNSNFKKYTAPVISSLTILNENITYYNSFQKDGFSFDGGNKDIKFCFGINKSEHSLVEYRHMLSPIDTEWSEWDSEEDEVYYSQIKGGDYQLNLQSRINGGTINETSLTFSIDKLWYQTTWIIVPIFLIIGTIILGLFFIMIKINNLKLKRQKHHFTNREIKQSLDLKNEQLLQYIEIISHKNAFLNKVRNGLEGMRSAEAQRWVNMISDEVNNEKKEFLFFKLFSEVHQDFISRIGAEYPSLTSNDIRILSFIRVNLEKTEISNLMNITPRSLDTIRYRIRKKMDIDQKVDFYQFIRNF